MKKLKQSQYYGIGLLVLMLVVFWAVFKVLAPTTFGSPEKLATYMKSALIYAVGGCGLYFICVMGPFDMSVGANIVLSSIIACNASEKFGYAGLIIAPLICGTIIGLINGIVYIKLHISSLIVTCALSLIYEAFSVYATNGKNVILSADYRAFGDYPVNLILALIAYFLCAFILKYTKIGIYTYAIGSNEVVAKNMGVNVSKYKIVAFTLAGFFFGLAFKKYGHPVIAIVIGEMIIQLMFNGFVALGAPTTIQNVVTGVALLVIVALTTKPVKGLVVK